MAKPYTINIVNGEGTGRVLSGSYNVTSVTNGYDNASIDPTTLQVDKTTTNYSFTIGATGTLTIHVTEDGQATGTPVVGATFNRCDSNGTTYGEALTSDALGNVTFANVPFALEDAPLIYYKQTASDQEHEFDDTLANTSMTTNTATIEVMNALPVERTISLTDENYSGLSIETGQIGLN